MDTLANLKRRLAAMREHGMIGLSPATTNLSPGARMLLAQLTRVKPVSPAPPVVRPPAPPAPPPVPEPKLIAVPGGNFGGGII